MTYFIGTDRDGTFNDCMVVGIDGHLFLVKGLATKSDPAQRLRLSTAQFREFTRPGCGIGMTPRSSWLTIRPLRDIRLC